MLIAFMNKGSQSKSRISFILRAALLSLLACVSVSSLVHAQSAPPNIDFSGGDFSNWLCYTGRSAQGYAPTGPALTGEALSGPVAGPPARHAITFDTLRDPFGGFPIVAPGGGQYSLKIGNSDAGAQAERMRYYIRIPSGASSYNVLYKMAVVFEAYGHDTADVPSFRVTVSDSASGAVIPSANNLYIAGASLPGFQTSVVSPYVSYLPWTMGSLRISGYAGKTVVLEITTLDCADGGHFGYGYFDVISVNRDQTVSAERCSFDSNKITFQGPPGYKFYRWFDQNFTTALNAPGDTTRTQTLPLPASAQYYNLVVYPYASAAAPDTLQTEEMSDFTVTASPKKICLDGGGQIVLSCMTTGTRNPLTFEWSGSYAFSSFYVPNPICLVFGPALLVVTVRDVNGCIRRDTVRVATGSYHVNAGSDVTTCLGTPVQLHAQVTPAFPGYVYRWGPAVNLSDSSAPDVTFTPSAVGTQQLIVQVDSGQCSYYDTVNIRTLPNTFAVHDTTVCAGAKATPLVEGDTSFIYSWSPSGRLSFPVPSYPGSDMNPVFDADTTTTFLLTASYPGCPDITKELTVHVEPWPQVDIGSDTLTKRAMFPINITASVSPGWFTNYIYRWEPNTNINSPGNASIRFDGATDTSLAVVVSTPAGCQGSDSVYISIIDEGIIGMPNALAPGIAGSRIFRPAWMDPSVAFGSMRIYNRWGSKIFETTDWQLGWDGTYNGAAQPAGVYMYVVELRKKANGEAVMQTGNVTLLR